MTISEAELRACLEVLERSRELDPNDPRFLELERAAAHLRKQAKKKRKLQRRREAAAHDRALRDQVSAGEGAELRASGAQTRRERACYVCKQPYRQLHDHYRLLCPTCGDASQAMRELPVSLAGRRALVTGGRVKIGYAVALRCLRAGAEVVVTTRFAADAAARFAAEPDVADWRERLEIHGLDFRRLDDVMRAIAAWRAGPPLDLLINNAAQTVWHAPEHYAALHAGEREASALPVSRWDEGMGGPAERYAALLAGVDMAIDLRREHSWIMRLAEVPPVELVEAQVVNSIVPALLCSQLEPAMLRSRFPDRYIVNVSAIEGQFQRTEKLTRHPHTNMAKAALNMLTRTSAEDYAERGIYMVAVDPGWVSHEGPPSLRAKAEAQGFRPPLDCEDAAARVLDPVARGLAGRPVYGVLLKDFAEVPW